MQGDVLTAALRALDSTHVTAHGIRTGGMRSVTESVRERVLESYPGASPEELECFLFDLVRARCASALAEEGIWIRRMKGDMTQVRLSVGGRVLSGSYRISPKRIHVELDSEPAPRIRDSVLLDWATFIYTEEPFDGSPASPEGAECAERLFLGLCVEEMSRDADAGVS